MNRAWLLLLITAAGCDSQGVATCERADLIEVFADEDGDGFGAGSATEVCAISEGQSMNRLDCDDTNPEIFPGAAETCNQRDDDCDGVLDDGFPVATYHADIDGDGYGSVYPSVATCGGPPAGFVSNAEDCDDDNDSIYPNANEVCNDGIDDDCDGLADDADPSTSETSKTAFYEDNDSDGFGDLDREVLACEGRGGLVDNYNDCDDSTADITNFPYPADRDLDGYGDEIDTIMSCAGYPGTADNRDDCDDSDEKINIPKEWYPDLDADGWGEPPAESFGCYPPNGMILAPYLGECDDTDPAINGGAKEICNDGIDQNCNGKIDCLDNDCVTDAACLLPCADEAVPSEVPVRYSVGPMLRFDDDYNTPCWSATLSGGQDITLQWRAPFAGTFTFDAFDSWGQYPNRRYYGGGYGPFLMVHEDCTDGSMIACNAYSYIRMDTDGDGVLDYRNYYDGLIQEIDLDEGQVILIRMDSYYRGAPGVGVLRIYESGTGDWEN